MHEQVQRLIKNIESVFVGKPDAVQACVAGLIAGGHILIEDVPGIGKTLLAKALARSIDAEFSRIQFTPDMLPSDITGGFIYNQKTGDFDLVKGPVFTNILLADEINRTTPRTQSALLEAMEERQVSVEGETHPLPGLFFVIATQNPIELQGVYPLPEAQLDRFLMRISIGYPETADELRIVDMHSADRPLDRLKPVLKMADLLELQREAAALHIDPDLKAYAVAIVKRTREDGTILLGASPRATLALVNASRATAFVRGLDFVPPGIVKETALKVLNHRIQLTPQARLSGTAPAKVIGRILEEVKVPE
ncbi:MAG: MoxR family ATPase [Planctomycetota bacterium]